VPRSLPWREPYNAEPEFDDLFQHHLRCACQLASLEPPLELDQSIVPHALT
jgi:hypothetical protein